jgi:2-C-methyl-D-erythritol 4-phosphate cytidylyltransferase
MTGSGQNHRTDLRTVAAVLAGGTGTRVGLHTPKQLVKVAGKAIIEHTIEALHTCDLVDEIVVLMTPGYTDDVAALLGNRYPKVSKVLEGGATRNETTQRALDAIADDECNVLLHDAVRPLLDQRIIEECVRALRNHGAVDVAIPSADTIVEVENDIITSIPDRRRLRRGQTPQCFRISTIRKAYELAWQDPDFTATDDCSVVLKYLPEVPIYVVDGAEHNMKITHPVDIFLADKLFQLASHAPPDTPDDYAERMRGHTLVVFGGSYGIGADIVAMARGFGANVFAFSRSETGTHVERATDVQAALTRAHDETGRIDYVVNTAGVLHRGKLSELDEAAIEESVRVNYVAPLMIARLALPYLSATKGHLLLYTSSSYTRGRADYSVYSSTKSAVVNLTQALADEWADFGVRVNCVNPERTLTPMRVRAFGEEAPESLLASGAVALTSIDVLLSDITGQVIDVRRQTPPGSGVRARTAGDAERVSAALAAAEEQVGDEDPSP